MTKNTRSPRFQKLTDDYIHKLEEVAKKKEQKS